MSNKNDRINHNDSSTDFFLKYMKKEKQEKEKEEEQKEEFNDRKVKTIQFFGNIYNSINKVLDHILLSKRAVIILSIVLTPFCRIIGYRHPVRYLRLAAMHKSLLVK